MLLYQLKKRTIADANILKRKGWLYKRNPPDACKLFTSSANNKTIDSRSKTNMAHCHKSPPSWPVCTLTYQAALTAFILFGG